MTPHDFRECSFQSHNVQMTAQSNRRWHVVGHIMRLQLTQKPQSLLRKRKGQGLITRDRFDRRSRKSRFGLLNDHGQFRNRGRLEELPQEREHPIVTVCTVGNLSIRGMLVLQSLGYSNVRSLNGGTVAWAEKGLPTNG